MNQQDLSILKNCSPCVYLGCLIPYVITEQIFDLLDGNISFEADHLGSYLTNALIALQIKFVFSVEQTVLCQSLQFYCPF